MSLSNIIIQLQVGINNNCQINFYLLAIRYFCVKTETHIVRADVIVLDQNKILFANISSVK